MSAQEQPSLLGQLWQEIRPHAVRAAGAAIDVGARAGIPAAVEQVKKRQQGDHPAPEPDSFEADSKR